MSSKEAVQRCPRCSNILAQKEGGTLYCATCEKLLRAYCRDMGVDYDVARRIFVDPEEHVSWKWKNYYERDVYFTGKYDLAKKFRKALGL